MEAILAAGRGELKPPIWSDGIRCRIQGRLGLAARNRYSASYASRPRPNPACHLPGRNLAARTASQHSGPVVFRLDLVRPRRWQQRRARGRFCSPRPRRIGGSSSPRTMACGGERSSNFSWLLQQARQAMADYVLLADQDDIWHADKVARQVQALQAAEAAGGQRRSATGLLRCRGGRCRAAARACIVPPPEPPALWFRPAVEDAAGPQFRPGVRLCRESPARGTRLAVARGRGFARLVAGPLCGRGGRDYVPRCAAAGVSSSRGECQPDGLLERHSAAAPRRGGGAGSSAGRASCDRSNRPRPCATACASGMSLPGKRGNCSKPSAASWISPDDGKRFGICTAWACRRSVGRGGSLFDLCMLRLSRASSRPLVRVEQ